MSIMPPTYVRMKVRCEYCGKEYDADLCIGGHPFDRLSFPIISIPLLIIDKIFFSKKENKCPHCGKRNGKFIDSLSKLTD